MSRKNQRKEYDDLWKEEPFKTRGVNYIITPTQEQNEILLELKNRFISTTNKLSRYAYK